MNTFDYLFLANLIFVILFLTANLYFPMVKNWKPKITQTITVINIILTVVFSILGDTFQIHW